MEKKKAVLKSLILRLERGQPLIIVGLDDKRIPNLHNFIPERYRDSVKHCGFGLFKGKTEHGDFHFLAGGAMIHYNFNDGSWLSWSPIDTTDEVIADLGYDFNRVIKALKQIISRCGKSLSMSIFLFPSPFGSTCLSSHKMNYKVSIGKITYSIQTKRDHIIRIPRIALTYNYPVCDICNKPLKAMHVKILVLSLHAWGCVCDACIERYHDKLPIYTVNACPKCLKPLKPLKPLDSPEVDFYVCDRCSLAFSLKLHKILARV